ncbi:MAG: hypothetical protein QOG67_3217 [Verrucomicrobiota bacterium]
MHHKLLTFLLITGFGATCSFAAPSPSPSESPSTSASPAKHRSHKKADAAQSASPAESPAASASPEKHKSHKKADKAEASATASPAAESSASASASPKEKHTRKKKTEAEASPAASPAAESSASASASPKEKHTRKKKTEAAEATPTASPSPGKFKLGNLFKPKTEGSPAGAAASEAGATPIPGGGHGMVWVNTETHIYHKEGSRFYGRTKRGKYVTENQAKDEGDKASKEEMKGETKEGTKATKKKE